MTGAGTSNGMLVLGVAIVQAPAIARIVRSATLEQSVRGFVEAAVARGEGTFAILRREIAAEHRPADRWPTSACASRYSIILVASVNFLGLGLQPPAADWALMISENRAALTLNPWAVLAPARDDRAADDRGEPGRRRGRADAGHLGRSAVGASA